MKKEYVISKKCDQKDKDFREYQFVRELEVDEEGYPLESSLDNIIKDEPEEKSVAFFIGDDYITMLSYKNRRKFTNKVFDEYNSGFKKELYSKFFLASDEKIVSIISEHIEYIKSNNIKIIGKENDVKGIKHVRTK